MKKRNGWGCTHQMLMRKGINCSLKKQGNKLTLLSRIFLSLHKMWVSEAFRRIVLWEKGWICCNLYFLDYLGSQETFRSENFPEGRTWKGFHGVSLVLVSAPQFWPDKGALKTKHCFWLDEQMVIKAHQESSSTLIRLMILLQFYNN